MEPAVVAAAESCARGWAVTGTHHISAPVPAPGNADFSKEQPESLERDQDPQTTGLGKASFLMKPG